MKRNFTLLACFLTLLLTSCGSDDDAPSNASVPGTWNLVSVTTSAAQDVNQDGTASTDFIAETNNCNIEDTLVFNEDGTLVSNSREIELDISGSLSVEIFCLPNVENYTWSQVDNTVLVPGNGSLTLNGNQMTITETSVSLDIAMGTFPLDYTFVYQKQ